LTALNRGPRACRWQRTFAGESTASIAVDLATIFRDPINRSMADAPWYVYIVRCSDDSLYTGIAKELEARIAQHNVGSGAKYTRSRRPVSIVYSESASDRGAALRREHEIKRMPVASKRRLVDQQANKKSQ
jgi:putative endonuclease